MNFRLHTGLVTRDPRFMLAVGACLLLSGCQTDRIASVDTDDIPAVSLVGARGSTGVLALNDAIATARHAATTAHGDPASHVYVSWSDDASPDDVVDHLVKLRKVMFPVFDMNASRSGLGQDVPSLAMEDFGTVDGSSLITKAQVNPTTRRVDFTSNTICQGFGTLGETQMKKLMRIVSGGTFTWNQYKVYVDTAAIANHTDSVNLSGPPQQGQLDTEHGCRALPGDAWDAMYSGYIVGV